jgi:hypothetical protein
MYAMSDTECGDICYVFSVYRSVWSSGEISLEFGVVRTHIFGQSVTYSSMCSFGAFNDSTSCHTILAAGVMTMLAAILSLVFAVFLAIFLVKSRASNMALSQMAQKLYSFSGLVHTFTSLTFFLWLIGQQTHFFSSLTFVTFLFGH